MSMFNFKKSLSFIRLISNSGYYKGKTLQPLTSKVVDYHPVAFPSDHAAVVTVFKVK